MNQVDKKIVSKTRIWLIVRIVVFLGFLASLPYLGTIAYVSVIYTQDPMVRVLVIIGLCLAIIGMVWLQIFFARKYRDTKV